LKNKISLGEVFRLKWIAGVMKHQEDVPGGHAGLK